MSGLRPLNLLILDDGHARLHGGLSVAVSAAALGRPVHIFFQGLAVRALVSDRPWPEDSAARDKGVAAIKELFAQAAELGIALTACESGLHLAGLTANALPPGIETGGLIGFLSGAGEGDLLTI